MRSFWVLIVLASVCGCASETAVLLGDTRQKINPALVEIYHQPPDRHYELIAAIAAPPNLPVAEQHAALRRQAGKLGANGVLVGPVGATGYASGTAEHEAHAIFVEKFVEIIY
ncbi:MAG: hypothetical protein R3200_06245 [Xanthomonadales bacterium]|nr:hypothetical protein [Xanthomonadales bacterium]